MVWYQEHGSIICLLQLGKLMELEIEPEISDPPVWKAISKSKTVTMLDLEQYQHTGLASNSLQLAFAIHWVFYFIFKCQHLLSVLKSVL